MAVAIEKVVPQIKVIPPLKLLPRVETGENFRSKIVGFDLFSFLENGLLNVTIMQFRQYGLLSVVQPEEHAYINYLGTKNNTYIPFDAQVVTRYP